MNFKDMLNKLSMLDEAVKKTDKGIEHTAEPGGYGRKDDEDEEGNKVKQDAPKRGRGRPKKGGDETGEVKKYDWSAFGATGKDVKLKPWDKKKTTKHSLKEWVQEIEEKYMSEAGVPGQQLQVKPMPGAAQLVDPATNKVVATGRADKINAMKGSIAQGDVQMTGKMEENNKTGKKTIKRPGIKEADIPSSQGIDTRGAGLGAGRSDLALEGKKPDFTDVDDDGNETESWTKAEKDKEKKTKVKESMDTRLRAAHHAGKSHALAKEGYNCRYDDMEEARMYHQGFKEGLDECYGQVPIQGMVDEMDAPALPPATVPGMADASMDEGNAFTKALAVTPAGKKFSVGNKTFTDRSGYDARVFESWDNELSSLLEEYDTIQEGMTVSISKGQQGMPDSVSVTAQDGEADQLLSLIKSAGLGLFGGDDAAPHDGQSSPMSLQPADGGEVEGDIDVVDDHDGMMALIKKVTGGAGQPDTVAIGGDQGGQDYEEEESSQGGEEQGQEEQGEEQEETTEACESCGQASCQCEENVEEDESYDQELENVAEATPQEAGAEEEAETASDENAEAAEDMAAAEYDKTNESEDSDEDQINEWANEAGGTGTDAAFKRDIEFMTRVIAGGLNKEKSTGQQTVPVLAGDAARLSTNTQASELAESITDWKALAGIK